jgi:hypothetical protein
VRVTSPIGLVRLGSRPSRVFSPRFQRTNSRSQCDEEKIEPRQASPRRIQGQSTRPSRCRNRQCRFELRRRLDFPPAAARSEESVTEDRDQAGCVSDACQSHRDGIVRLSGRGPQSSLQKPFSPTSKAIPSAGPSSNQRSSSLELARQLGKNSDAGSPLSKNPRRSGGKRNSCSDSIRPISLGESPGSISTSLSCIAARTESKKAASLPSPDPDKAPAMIWREVRLVVLAKNDPFYASTDSHLFASELNSRDTARSIPPPAESHMRACGSPMKQ